jgi:hypothetical protein
MVLEMRYFRVGDPMIFVAIETTPHIRVGDPKYGFETKE